MKHRDPKGKFIWRSDALYHWLPQMLTWISGDPLEKMLERAAHWCVIKAAEECELNARYLREHTDEREIWLRPVERAMLWKKRRDVLFETIERLKGIK